MDEFYLTLLALIVIAVFVSAIVLPIASIVISVRSRRRLTEQISRLGAGQAPAPGPQISDNGSLAAAIEQLRDRVYRLEADLERRSSAGSEAIVERVEPIGEESEKKTREAPARIDQFPQPPAEVLEQPASGLWSSEPSGTKKAEEIESIIGRRWVGWTAVGLILFAAAFFLKYAFENRWIGELGRVAIGVAAGVSLTAFGFRYHKRGWRVFSQILTAGGVVLLYLSVYAAFGYYHLTTQKTAFVFLAILVAETAGLALLYNAPAIAIMALIGGFLAPILLRSERDQYVSLFGYIAALDIGALALLKRWTGLSSLAFGGTHLLYWIWYDANYHPKKLVAVMVFQSAVFLVFLLAQLGKQLIRRESATLEDLVLLMINPFAYFATAYHLLNGEHHEWMGVYAIAMALVYAAATEVLLKKSAATRSESLLMIAVALTFVTLAIPIQLKSNWITIGWSVESLAILWVGIETGAQRLRVIGLGVLALAVGKLVLRDTPLDYRPMFTPILNKYFLSSLVVTACLFGTVAVYRGLGARRQISARKLALTILLAGLGVFWFVSSVETHSFFDTRAVAEKVPELARHERWLGQMALSVLWSVYAGILAAVGFRRRSAVVRWAALVIFGTTVTKVMLVDIAELRQFYRIIAFFVLGLLLLVVAWRYQRAFHSKESLK